MQWPEVGEMDALLTARLAAARPRLAKRVPDGRVVDRMVAMSGVLGVNLVGRDDQLRVQGEDLDAVDSGGRVVGVLGQPGVGKSAVLAHSVENAVAAGFGVLSARGSQSEAGACR